MSPAGRLASAEAAVKHQAKHCQASPEDKMSSINRGHTHFTAELIKRYSNPVYQGRRLRRMIEIAEKSAKQPVRAATPLPQVQRVDRRLTAEAIAEPVQTYRDGASTTYLRQRYELSQGSVIKILHSHGVEMRGQGLTDREVATAAELYRSGKTLAQLGERFGASPNAVRRALVSAGVVMRARGKPLAAK